MLIQYSLELGQVRVTLVYIPEMIVGLYDDGVGVLDEYLELDELERVTP